MWHSSSSTQRSVVLVLAACSTTGCSMIGALNLSGPVLPDTLVAILVLLGGMFAVAWSRYAHRPDPAPSRKGGQSDSVA